eukprot:JZ549192.1.p1 GENE.JZ549192.1~~JZ549192.1.p1  ORF type:complete len:163 (+),score=16.90 JZ549192.1:126-614(+)
MMKPVISATPEQELKAQWKADLQRGIDFDAWGNILEAQEKYRGLSASMGERLNDIGPKAKIRLTTNEHSLVTSMKNILDNRSLALDDAAPSGSGPAVTVDDVRQCIAVIDALFTPQASTISFPSASPLFVTVPASPSPSARAGPGALAPVSRGAARSASGYT